MNNGWAVANTTLMHERAGLGAGGGGAAGGGALPGTVAGHLDRRAGDFVAPSAGRSAPVGPAPRRGRGGGARLLIGLAQGNGTTNDPVIRQGLAQLHTLGEIGRFNAERLKATPRRPGATSPACRTSPSCR